MKETTEFIKCRLNANYLIFEEYLIYLIMRRDYLLPINFMFIKDEFELIKQMCENNNIKINSREDLEDVNPLLLNVLITLVKQELDETKLKIEDKGLLTIELTYNYILYPCIHEVYKKWDYFKKDEEILNLSKDLNLLNQINFRISILKKIIKKLSKL
jgi:hypothetical protein